MGNGVRYSEEEGRALLERLGRFKKNPTAPASVSTAEPAPAAPAAKKPSLIVVRFEQQLIAHGFRTPEKEYYAIPGRDYRLDYAWVPEKVGVEIQGLQHRIKGRFKDDIEKRALHLVAGWRVLELDGRSIKEERSVAWLRALLG